MHEIPALEAALLPLDDQHALSRKNEEVFLRDLAVVHAHGLAWAEDEDVDAELREVGLRLFVRPTGQRYQRSTSFALDPASVTRVDHEPARTGGHEPGFGLLERCPPESRSQA